MKDEKEDESGGGKKENQSMEIRSMLWPKCSEISKQARYGMF
jgi:hypothetical protein